MKLVDVEYSFEGGKILFFFTSDGRVDFRELVKDLASVFRTRIELRQIGVRDGAKMLGGLGNCGRGLCCTTFLDDFQPVSIKMAKTQSLSLNPTKISGVCGRLMCCLKYEQDAYEYLLKTVPRVDMTVNTPQGKGTVTEVNLLRRTVKVKLDDSDSLPQIYHADRLGYCIGNEYKEPEPEPEQTPPPAPDAEEKKGSNDKNNNGGGRYDFNNKNDLNNKNDSINKSELNNRNDRSKAFKYKQDFKQDNKPVQPKPQLTEEESAEETDEDDGIYNETQTARQNGQNKMPYRKHRRGKKPYDKYKNKPPV